MKLLCFAHRGEAKSFIDYFNLKSSQITNLDLYYNSDIFLLITGEGIQLATESLVQTLSLNLDKITSVLNMGVAGALNRTLKLQSIYKIRTVYAQKSASDLEFKSFSTNDNSEILDAITSVDRVLDNNEALKLSHFADIVDRELWAIGSVCKRFNLPFQSYKIISDYAGNSVNCFDISMNTDRYSEALLNVYLLNLSNQDKSDQQKEIDLPESFYATLSQKRQLSILLTKLELKNNKSLFDYLKSDKIKALNDVDIQPKKRTMLLIEFLTEELNPMQSKLKYHLNDVISGLKKVEAKVSFSNHLENDDLSINATIHDEYHYQRFKEAINAFDYKLYQNILNGKLNKD